MANGKPISHNKKLETEIAQKLSDKTLFNRVVNDPHSRMTDACLIQMGYVLDYLHDNQIPYRVEQVANGSYVQLQAVVDSPKARITLTGKPEHVDFIGSVLKTKQNFTNRFTFTTTPYNSSGGKVGNVHGVKRTYTPTKEDIANLLDICLKSDMSSLMNHESTYQIDFDGGRVSQPIHSAYCQNGNLKRQSYYQSLYYQQMSQLFVLLGLRKGLLWILKTHNW